VLTSLGDAAGFVVRGTVEGPCDPEVFSFELTRAATATIRLLSATGQGCVALSAGNGVELILYQGMLEVGRAVSDEQGCAALEVAPFPALAASDVAPAATSTYHVQLRAPASDEPAPFGYALAFELR
jgi:hypothetical protein